jgi:hypothetical protein
VVDSHGTATVSISGRDMEAPTVVVISVMSIAESGLAVSSSRYVEALDSRSWNSIPIVVDSKGDGSGGSNEHGNAIHVPKVGDVGRVPGVSDARVAFWVGLHTDEEVFQLQLEQMAELNRSGVANVVLPERTTVVGRSGYNDFQVRSQKDLGVVSLVHLNETEAEKWREWLPDLPSYVAPVPIPDAHFELVRASADPRPSATVTFMGRLTPRKGADVLTSSWPAWRGRFLEDGYDVSLRVFGRDFDAFPEIADALALLVQDPAMSTQWTKSFFDTSDLGTLPGRTVGLSLSRQDFDGIAVSEYLAIGVPVVSTATTGHVALSTESSAVQIASDIENIYPKLLDLIRDDELRRHLGDEGRKDMLTRRSVGAVGRLLSGILEVSVTR